ncbi:hypothetical protein [Streptomyces sp. NPDC054958]
MGAQVDAFGGQAVPALPHRLQHEPLRLLDVITQAHGLGVEAVELRAGEVRPVAEVASPGHDDQVAVLVQAGLDEERDVVEGVATGAARHEHHRVLGRFRRSDGRNDRRGRLDGPAAGAGAVLGHLQEAAPRAAQRFDRLGRLRAGPGHEPQGRLPEG